MGVEHENETITVSRELKGAMVVEEGREKDTGTPHRIEEQTCRALTERARHV